MVIGYRLLQLAAIGGSVPAWAQNVDYAALRAMVGEPVTTSVTGKPQRASDAPASLIIVTRDQIARSPARDVPGILKAYAGIDVNAWTAGQSDVAVRGGVQPYNPRLLVLVDGRQVYLDHYGMTNWNMLGVELNDIEQIELVKGPASALFGFNAATGVVNIITREPRGDRSFTGGIEAGGHGQLTATASLSVPLGAIAALRLSGGRERFDELSPPAGEALQKAGESRTAERDSIGGEVHLRPDGLTRIVASASYAASRQAEILPNPYLSKQRLDQLSVGLRADHDTPWGSVTGQILHNDLDADYGVGGDGLPDGRSEGLVYSNRTRLLSAQASTLVRLDTVNTLRVGGEYRESRFRLPSAFSGEIGYDVAAASAMLDLHPADTIAITLAGRVDRLALMADAALTPPTFYTPADFDRQFTAISFNAAVLGHAGANGTWRVNGGRGVQSPSLVDFGFRTIVPFDLDRVVYAGNPGLRPSIVWSGEAGYDHRWGNSLRIGGTAFYVRTDDAIGLPGPSAPIVVAGPDPTAGLAIANAGSFDSYGVELAMSGELTARLQWTANYTYTAGDERLARGQDETLAYALSPGASTPSHKINGTMTYISDRWYGTLLGRYTSSTRQLITLFDGGVFRAIDVPDALAFDAKLGWKLAPGMTATVAALNLTGARGAGLSPIAAERRVRAGISIELR